MNIILLLPVLLPLAAAVFAYGFGKNKRVRQYITFGTIGFCLITAILFIIFGAEGEASLPVSAGGLHFVLCGFRRLYLLVIAFAFAATTVLAKEYMSHYEDTPRYCLFLLLTLGAVNGVFLARDLMTAFTFYEIASFTSFVWVIQEETPGAVRAAKTYLAVAVVGGLLAFMGVLLVQDQLGTLVISELSAAAALHGGSPKLYAGGVCLLLGFGAKAGMFPLHIWLPKAHPVAPAPASALLSGILTKVGIFGVAAISIGAFFGDIKWGSVLLLLGTVTMVLGAVLGVLSIDLKRTLACSSMSQIGFVLVGIACCCILGEHGALAAQGTVLHMLNHSLFKVILFSAAGIVYMNLHRLDLNDIRGFGRGKYALMIPFLMGSLGIAGVPLFSGYISKTLLHEALIECHALPQLAVTAAEWLFLFSGGCTAAYMAKLFTALFLEKHPTRQAEYDSMTRFMSRPTAAALAVAAVPALVLGMPPLMNAIAKSAGGFFGLHEFHGAHFFSVEALKGSAISLMIGAAVFFAVRKLTYKNGVYTNIIPQKLDLEDGFYRPLLALLSSVFGSIMRLFGENVVSRRIAKAAELTAAAGAKLVSLSTDFAVLALRRTLLREVKVKDHDTGPDHMVEVVGSLADKVTHVRHHSIFFAGIRLRFLQLRKNIAESFTFALMMTCIGICVVLVILMLG